MIDQRGGAGRGGVVVMGWVSLVHYLQELSYSSPVQRLIGGVILRARTMSLINRYEHLAKKPHNEKAESVPCRGGFSFFVVWLMV